jgi:hypothetical protein
MGAAGQHNHRLAGRSSNLALRDVSRNKALTGRKFDASIWLGWVGQLGWVHDYGGKASVFRPSAWACLYVGPSEKPHGQLVCDIDRNKVDTVRTVLLGHDPTSVPFVVATSDLYRPMGAVGMPDPSAYTIRLRSMLLPGVDSTGLMLAHDALHGEPAFLYGPVPLLDEEGGVVVVPKRIAPSSDDMHGLADLSDDDSDSDEGDFGSPFGPSAALSGALAVPAGQRHASASLDSIAASSSLAARMVKGTGDFAPDTPLIFDPGVKAFSRVGCRVALACAVFALLGGGYGGGVSRAASGYRGRGSEGFSVRRNAWSCRLARLVFLYPSRHTFGLSGSAAVAHAAHVAGRAGS